MKKRLLALILSAAMMTESVLPVVAADDVEVTASENAAEEVAEDVVAEEEPAAEEVEEDAVAEETAEIEDVELEDVVVEEDGEFTYVSGYKVSNFEKNSDIILDDETELDYAASGSSHIYAKNKISVKVSSEEGIDIKGTNYPVNATVAFNSEISYRGRKIKPVEKIPKSTKKTKKDDLGANVVVTSSSLYSIANVLSTAGNVSSDIFKWTYTAKKNKDVAQDSYFTVKATVSSKIAKEYGIKGKDLKLLKKAVKLFNKYSKKNHIPFAIVPVNMGQVFENKSFEMFQKILKTYRNGILISTEVVGVELRVRIDSTQPTYITNYSYSKWTKVSSKDATIKKISKNVFSITPLNANFTGRTIIVDYNKGEWYYAN